MKKYIVDTNIFLRFLLKDNDKFFQTAKQYFTQAKKGKIVLILIPQVLFEIDYVLRGVYSLSQKETANILSNLLKTAALNVNNRIVLIKAVEKYKNLNIDLFDLYLFEKAKQEKAQVLSFDKDFEKIKKAKF